MTEIIFRKTNFGMLYASFISLLLAIVSFCASTWVYIDSFKQLYIIIVVLALISWGVCLAATWSGPYKVTGGRVYKGKSTTQREKTTHTWEEVKGGEK